MDYKLEPLTAEECGNAAAFLGNVLSNKVYNRAAIISTAAEAFARISRGNLLAVRTTRPDYGGCILKVDEIVFKAMSSKDTNLPKALRTFQRLASVEIADNGENHQTATTKEMVSLLQGRALDALVLAMCSLEELR